MHATREVDPEFAKLFAPSEIYHENSKLHPSDLVSYAWIDYINTAPEMRRMVSKPDTGFRGYPTIPLPRDFPVRNRPFAEVATARRSIRSFSGEPITLAALARLLLLAGGVTAEVQDEDGTLWRLRAAPSGGGLYPIELYCAALRVEDLGCGLYLYAAAEHALKHLGTDDPTATLADAMYLERTVAQAAACILLAGAFDRTKFKYGERGYRFALLEAGHIAQNLLLAAEEAGLGAVAVGGFADDPLNRFLGLDGVSEAAIYAILIGRRYC